MSEKKRTARARVKVVVSFEVDAGHWGDDTTVAQVHRNALRSAEGTFSQIQAAAQAHIGAGNHTLLRLEKIEDPVLIFEEK